MSLHGSHRRACASRRRAAASRLVQDQSGTTALSFGLLATVAMGFVGLGVDLSAAYQARRHIQGAADSSAFSAAATLLAGENDMAAVGRAVAGRYGFVEGSSGVTVAINQPPASGPYAGSTQAVEVVIQRPGIRFFSGFFSSTQSSIRGRAVAKINAGAEACVVALNGSASISSATLKFEGCSLYSNSTAANAFEMSGESSLTAAGVSAVGGSIIGSNSMISTQNGVLTKQRPIQDPYRDVPVPPYSGCTYNNASLKTGTYGGSYTSPVVFCNGLMINSGSTVTLNPGIYVIDRGEFRVNGGGAIRGTGVTIVLTSSTGSDYAYAAFNGQSIVDLTAPSTGPTAGMVLYQDRRAPSTGENILNGGAGQTLNGAVYFPNQMIRYSGGSPTAIGGCTQLIGGIIQLRGQSNFQMKCTGSGVRRAGSPPVSVVE